MDDGETIFTLRDAYPDNGSTVGEEWSAEAAGCSASSAVLPSSLTMFERAGAV